MSPPTAAIATAAIAATAAIVKKLLPPKQLPKPDHITRQEFHLAMDDMRDRLATTHLALTDKLDTTTKELRTALDNQHSAFEHRLDRIETAIARLDERTLP